MVVLVRPIAPQRQEAELDDGSCLHGGCQGRPAVSAPAGDQARQALRHVHTANSEERRRQHPLHAGAGAHKRGSSPLAGGTFCAHTRRSVPSRPLRDRDVGGARCAVARGSATGRLLGRSAREPRRGLDDDVAAAPRLRRTPQEPRCRDRRTRRGCPLRPPAGARHLAPPLHGAGHPGLRIRGRRPRPATHWRPGHFSTFRLNFRFDVSCSGSLTATLIKNLPAVFGVPEIIPELESLRP